MCCGGGSGGGVVGDDDVCLYMKKVDVGAFGEHDEWKRAQQQEKLLISNCLFFVDFFSFFFSHKFICA